MAIDVAEISTNTLEPDAALDSERLAMQSTLHLLRNDELSSIRIALPMRPNV